MTAQPASWSHLTASSARRAQSAGVAGKFAACSLNPPQNWSRNERAFLRVKSRQLFGEPELTPLSQNQGGCCLSFKNSSFRSPLCGVCPSQSWGAEDLGSGLFGEQLLVTNSLSSSGHRCLYTVLGRGHVTTGVSGRGILYVRILRGQEGPRAPASASW